MKSQFIILFILVACSITDFSSAQGKNRIRTRLYKHVETIDTVSGSWQPLHALARVTFSEDSLSVTIWYDWASEYINPLVRIKLSSQVKKNTATDKWYYNGSMFRSLNIGEECYVESYYQITDRSDQDITIKQDDYSVRYRINSKAPKEL